MTEDIVKFEERKPHEEFLPTTASENTRAAMIQMAVAKGADLDKLEKLMAVQERYEANEAKKAYIEAKAAFKAEAPTVIKDKENTQFKSKYPSESALLNTYSPILSKFGLEVNFDFPEKEGVVGVTCILSHRQGHCEKVTLFGPPDTSGSKNSHQQIKSAITYLRKTTLEAVLGVASQDPSSDDDGNGAGAVISEKQLSQIVDMINETGTDLNKFLKLADADTLDQIPAKKFDRSMEWLKNVMEAKKQKEAKSKPDRQPGQEG
jgi:hypothetical protein